MAPRPRPAPPPSLVAAPHRAWAIGRAPGSGPAPSAGAHVSGGERRRAARALPARALPLLPVLPLLPCPLLLPVLPVLPLLPLLPVLPCPLLLTVLPVLPVLPCPACTVLSRRSACPPALPVLPALPLPLPAPPCLCGPAAPPGGRCRAPTAAASSLPVPPCRCLPCCRAHVCTQTFARTRLHAHARLHTQACAPYGGRSQRCAAGGVSPRSGGDAPGEGHRRSTQGRRPGGAHGEHTGSSPRGCGGSWRPPGIRSWPRQLLGPNHHHHRAMRPPGSTETQQPLGGDLLQPRRGQGACGAPGSPAVCDAAGEGSSWMRHGWRAEPPGSWGLSWPTPVAAGGPAGAVAAAPRLREGKLRRCWVPQHPEGRATAARRG